MRWYSVRNIKKCNLTLPSNVCKAAPISFFWAPTTNSQKCVSKFSSTWLAHQTMAFLTGQPLHAPKSWYTAGGPMSHSLSTVGLSVAKAVSSQLGFLTQLCFIFKDICVSHLPSPTSLCAINKFQGLELTEPLFQQPPRVTLSYGRGGSRGRLQGVRTPTWDDLQFSNTTGILQKKNYVVYWCWSRARDECKAVF